MSPNKHPILEDSKFPEDMVDCPVDLTQLSDEEIEIHAENSAGIKELDEYAEELSEEDESWIDAFDEDNLNVQDGDLKLAIFERESERRRREAIANGMDIDLFHKKECIRAYEEGIYQEEILEDMLKK
jgi:hypothetical protein